MCVMFMKMWCIMDKTDPSQSRRRALGECCSSCCRNSDAARMRSCAISFQLLRLRGRRPAGDHMVAPVACRCRPVVVGRGADRTKIRGGGGGVARSGRAACTGSAYIRCMLRYIEKAGVALGPPTVLTDVQSRRRVPRTRAASWHRPSVSLSAVSPCRGMAGSDRARDEQCAVPDT